MPGHDDLDAEPAFELRVEVCFEPPERGVGCGLEVGHDPTELPGVYLLQVQRSVEVVGVARLAGELVPQAGELPHGLLDLPADGLRRLPGFPAQDLVPRVAQNLTDLVLPYLPAPDDAPVVAVDGVRLCL